MVFGVTLFPVLVYGLATWFMGPSSSAMIGASATLIDFYTYIYGALLDMGKDGMVAWGIVCAPYMVYEIVLLFQVAPKVLKKAPRS